ncbi:F-box protein DOR [Raphanus sativus]|uniref:F-box protein DOR n=1 Tax=Raphanus sativus TaxID=3726 RepID=A0A6J0LZD7_RAPSA|nr:F-box protein DOR [Raphanus sativus]
MQTQQQHMHMDEIPVDLIIEILSRLPTKTIARCRWVSKLWASIICRTDFSELFMTRSQARPQILFTFRKSDFSFFLTPQAQNKSSLVAKNHMKLPTDDSSQICGPVRGFVCLTNYSSGIKETVSTVCNLSTGQAIHLPNAKTNGNFVKSYLGFDPIDKQFKVLLINNATQGVSDEHQVLTLGTPNLSWRNIKSCCISYCYPHYYNDGICINGGLYYVAAVSKGPSISAIVCFDVKSEKLRIVNKAEGMELRSDSTLVNNKGKLGVFEGGWVGGVFTGETTSFELWVLVDAEKHEWSKHLYVLPPLWKNVVAKSDLYFVGVTGKDEIVFSKLYISDSFYVYYYNIEDNTVTRVEIQGMSAFKNFNFHVSLDHVEDVKLMQHV